MSTTSWVWAVVVVIIIGLGAWFFMSGGLSPVDITNENAASAEESASVSSEMPVPGSTVPETEVFDTPASVTVTYSDAGFSPAVVTIKKGDTVVWKNGSSGSMWVASAQHPTHTAYAGTSRTEHCGTAAAAQAFDQCSGTGDFSFTFDKVGMWSYHDHVNAGRFGKVVVE